MSDLRRKNVLCLIVVVDPRSCVEFGAETVCVWLQQAKKSFESNNCRASSSSSEEEAGKTAEAVVCSHHRRSVGSETKM